MVVCTETGLKSDVKSTVHFVIVSIIGPSYLFVRKKYLMLYWSYVRNFRTVRNIHNHDRSQIGHCSLRYYVHYLSGCTQRQILWVLFIVLQNVVCTFCMYTPRSDMPLVTDIMFDALATAHCVIVCSIYAYCRCQIGHC